MSPIHGIHSVLLAVHGSVYLFDLFGFIFSHWKPFLMVILSFFLLIRIFGDFADWFASGGVCRGSS